MTDPFVLAFALTFAASVHCVGMCGGLVLAVSAPTGSARLAILLRYALLQAGKASTYLFLGALAGAFGGALLRHPTFGWGSRALAVLAGVAIAAAGLSLLGLTRRSAAGGGVLGSALERAMAPLLSAKASGFPLVAGMVMGLLPCPLVYAGLGGAAASGSALGGVLVMGGVAAGTVPALLGVALFGAAVPLSWRRGLARLAGVLLLLVGLLNVAKGFAPARRAVPEAATGTTAASPAPAVPEAPPCPFHPAPTVAPAPSR